MDIVDTQSFSGEDLSRIVWYENIIISLNAE